VLIKFIVYLPGKAIAVSVELVRAGEEADLAVLRLEDEAEPIAALRLGDVPPAAGDEVIVMGCPTGPRSMLAQSGDAFIAELQAAKDSDFWSVAGRLAGAGFIAPLASRGIVAKLPWQRSCTTPRRHTAVAVALCLTSTVQSSQSTLPYPLISAAPILAFQSPRCGSCSKTLAYNDNLGALHIGKFAVGWS
jgi:hypothetical protein